MSDLITSLQLKTQQIELHAALDEIDMRLSRMYLGAIIALESSENPEHLVFCSHNMRELMEKLPTYLALPIENGFNMRVEVRMLETGWNDLLKQTSLFKDGQWAGEVDGPLRNFLKSTGRFFALLLENLPNRRKEFLKTHLAISKYGGILPESTKNNLYRFWDEAKRDFLAICHHNKETTKEELAEMVQKLEDFLLSHYFKPKATEELDELDALIQEGEGT